MNQSRPGITIASSFLAAIALCMVAGCQEPNYRNDVVSGPQGQVEVHRVAKDQPTVATPSNGPTVSQSPAVDDKRTIDQKIAALEAQVNRLNEEITKLKLQKEVEAK